MDDIADRLNFREQWNSIKVVVFVIAVAGSLLSLFLDWRRR
jgi:hypothetical protein